MTKRTRILTTKVFVVMFVFLFGLFSTSREASAAVPEFARSFGQAIFQHVKEGFVGAIDIRTTALSALYAVLIEGSSQALSSRSFDGMMNCVVKPYGVPLNFPEGAIDPTDDCSDMYAAAGSPYAQNATQNKGQMAIIGMAMIAEDMAMNEAPPINLAYYAKREVSDIPIIENTAYAASVGDDLLLNAVYEIWERMRNMAYGLLALFMLVIGIMIMVRHKVSPQTVVTIQQALPKIIISVILITFSYPIVAIGAALIVPLSAIAVAVVGPVENTTLLIAFLALGAAPILLIPGVGFAAMLLYIIMILVGIFFLVKLAVTIIASYLKLVLSMMTGPFIFAWGAVPGNEKAMTDWFKRVGVSIITVPIMIGGLRLTRTITDTLAVTVLTGTGTINDSGFLGISVSEAPSNAGIYFLIPILVIILLIQFGKVPQTLEETIMGKRRR